MWKHSLYIVIFSVCLIVSSASAGNYTEIFVDYARNDASGTTANWDIFDQSLTLNRTESNLTPKLIETASYPSGGFVTLYRSAFGDTYSLFIQRYDGFARPMWSDLKHVVSSSVYIAGEAIAVSGNDIVVVWSIGNPENRVYAQRFDMSGSTVWSMPVLVHQNTSLDNKGSCDVSAAPPDSVVIVWEDSRMGDQKIFSQKLDMSGTRIWSAADVQVHPGGITQERTPCVAVDATGRAFVAWEESANILMNRIENSGTPAWSNGALMTSDATDDQRFPMIALLEGYGLFISYKEQAFPIESVEVVFRDFTGNPLWPSDRVVWSIDGRVDNASLAITPSGVLIGMGSSLDGIWRPYTRLVDFEGDFPAPQPQVVPFSDISWINLRAFQLVYSIGTGAVAVAQHGMETLLLKTVAMGLTDGGDAEWEHTREISNLSGSSYAANASFVKGSDLSGGFSAVWLDTRNGAFDTFGRSFSDPSTRIGTHDTYLTASTNGATLSAEDVDGNRIIVTIDATGWPVDPPILSGQWFNSDWTPIADPFRISDLNGYPTNNFDITIDSFGRAAIVWADSRDPVPGMYYQVATRPGGRVFANDIKISDTSLTSYENIRIEAFADGSNGVLWIDDHVSGSHVYYAKPLWDGTMLFPNVMVDPDLGVNKRNADMMVYGSLAYVTYSTSGASDSYIYAQSLNDSFPSSPVLMGGPVDSCFGTEVAFLPPMSLVTAWSGLIGSEYGVWAQRVTGGVLEWSESRVNSLTSSHIVPLSDLVCPSADTTVVLFDHVTNENTSTPFYQVLDGTGARSFTVDMPLINPIPLYVDFGIGVSSKLNGTESVQWAAIIDADMTLNGGTVTWSLSPDGGFNWYGVTPGIPLTFAATGTDLRWRAKLYSDDAQQSTPEIRSVTVVWGSSSVYFTPDLDLNSNLFHAGDTFNLDLHLISSGGISADVFILLDVYGSYWFWPSWTQMLDFETRTPLSGVTEENVFNFVWPTVTGSASGLRFWVGALASGTSVLLGDIDMIEFGYE